LRFEYHYKADKKDGTFKSFYGDGSINSIGNYNDGYLNDTLTVFDTDGSLASKSVWKKNTNNSSTMIWKNIYSKKAKPDGTIEFINGKKYIWNLGVKQAIK
jgi:antitoxin component YwqK of YwqJK toxin-antitoxin module